MLRRSASSGTRPTSGLRVPNAADLQPISCPTPRSSRHRSAAPTDLFRATPGRRGGVVTLEAAARGPGRRRPARQRPSFRQVLRLPTWPATRRGISSCRSSSTARLVPRRRGRPVAPAGRPGLRPEVPVPRPGPPDPGQPRALRADRPVDRQEWRPAQRPVPPGDRDRLRRRMAGAIYRGLSGTCSPRLPLAVRTPNRVFLCHTIPDAPRPRRLDLASSRPTPGPTNR